MNPEEKELTIIWVEPPEQYRYLRAGLFYSRARNTPPKVRKDGLRIVGYAIGEHQRGARYYVRRYFFLKPSDCWNFNGCPAEGVDPLTIAPNVAGQRTERAVQFIQSTIARRTA